MNNVDSRTVLRAGTRVLMLLALCTLSGACKPQQERETSKPRPLIGFSIATDTFIIERWNKDVRIFTGAVRDLGSDVRVQLSAGGTKEQISQINYLVQSGIDVLVVVAHDTDLLAGVVKKVRDSGIPVIAYDRLVTGVPVDAYISFDNHEVGRLMGAALLNAVPRGSYVIVNGSIRDSNSYYVNAGLHEMLDPAITSGAIRIEEEIWLEEWSFDEARTRISQILDQHADVSAISCANDQIASAAIQVLSELQLAGKVAVVGQDADVSACQKIVEGVQLMTVYKPLGRLAVRAAELSIALAKGDSIPADRNLENGSDTPVPFYMEVPVAVFAHNLDTTVIKDGFHTARDIYRDLPARDSR